MKLKTDSKEIFNKHTNLWKLSNTWLNNELVKEQIKIILRIFPELNENKTEHNKTSVMY